MTREHSLYRARMVHRFRCCIAIAGIGISDTSAKPVVEKEKHPGRKQGCVFIELTFVFGLRGLVIR